jgi:hypothetical protein
MYHKSYLNNVIKASIFVHNKIVNRRFLQRLRTTGQNVIELTHVLTTPKLLKRNTLSKQIFMLVLQNLRTTGPKAIQLTHVWKYYKITAKSTETKIVLVN